MTQSQEFERQTSSSDDLKAVCAIGLGNDEMNLKLLLKFFYMILTMIYMK